MMEIKKIYFDMDGVLADFNGGIEKLCGIKSRTQTELSDEDTTSMWNAVKETEHFYNRLDPLPDAIEMFNVLYRKYGDRCEILSAIPKPKRGIIGAGEDKTKWIHRLFSRDLKVNIVYKEEKKDYCTGSDCILIDDLDVNIEEWKKAGGKGILHRSAEETLAVLKTMGLL